MTNEYKPSERATQFIARLDRLDPGGRARLKRGAGAPLAEVRGALGLFYNLLPAGVGPQQEEIYFLVATLFPLADGGGRGDLGLALRHARDEKHAKGLDRRVEALLDADSAQLPYRLRRAIHFLRSQRVRIDWPRLLDDLLFWSNPERRVQRRWARSYFASPQAAGQLPTSPATQKGTES
jgi:CRISPR system Cascade subunit CasB